MLTPTRGITPSRALLSVGEDIARNLDQPRSVTEVWLRLQAQWNQRNLAEKMTFDWFALAVSMLFAVGVVGFTEDGRLRRTSATPSS